jgi:peptide/nickel transport system permease protein
MHTYIVKRIFLFIPTLIFVTVVVFIILRVVPGDPALLLLMGDPADAEGPSEYAEKELAELRAKLGTDRHIVVQYGDWVWKMLRLDFGISYWWDTPVVDDLRDRFPITLELTLLALLWATLLAVPLGVLSAIKQDSWGDYAGRLITISGIALPNFWIAILIVFFLILFFRWIPPLGYENVWENPWTNLQQLIFPAVALGFSNMAFIARVTRSAMLDVFREDYIRTARSKGLREPTVVNRHALKNALLPVITVSGYEFGRLLAGTVIIEVIFMIPGVGRFLIDSIFHRDYPAIQAVIVILAMIVLVLNLILDVMYAWLNPRIRYS